MRRYLRERGARQLNDDDEALPIHLHGKTGEHWLLPTAWLHAPKIVVRFGETYPDDPPTLFMPPSLNGERDLLPHVTETGDICTIVRTNVINPDRPLEVLLRCLEKAKENLNREWSDTEMASHINPELKAYWNYRAEETLLYQRADLAAGAALEVRPWKIAAKLSRATVAGSKFSSPLRLAVVVELASNETVPFLRAPGPFLVASRSVRESLNSFAENICERTVRLKTFDLHFVLIARWEGGECVLSGCVPQSIRSKGKTASGLVDAMLGALSQKGLQPWHAEDIGTDRLLRRTTGPDFDPAILNQRVAIIGCGSLGGFVADGLSRSGVRRLFLCDTETLKIENLLRHILPVQYTDFAKAASLKDYLLRRVPDGKIEICFEDIRTQNAITALTAFAPDLVVFATGDTNTDLTMSSLLPLVHRAALAFTWADPNLDAGHLVYQPTGGTSFLRELHDENTAIYKHSVRAEAAPIFQESGCQSSYSPYSGLAMVGFATAVAMKLRDWLHEPPATREVIRLVPTSPWESIPPFSIVTEDAA